MSSLGVVTETEWLSVNIKLNLINLPNSVISAKANPMRNRLVLLLLNSQSALGAEGLVGWLKNKN